MNANRARKNPAKECAVIGVFTAMTIAVQFALFYVPGVELVTVLFVSFSYAFGAKRGMVAATAFTLLRQLIFGFFPTVLILYFVYYNLLALAFGSLARVIKAPLKGLVWIVFAACAGAVCFTLLDDVITPLYLGFNAKATQAYFVASLPFMGAQTLNVAVTTAFLFVPLDRAFSHIAGRKRLPDIS